MRQTAAVLVGGLVGLLALGPAAGAALLEPVTIEASAPESVAVGAQFKLEIAVEAEAGALAIASGPPRVQVKLAARCGGSFLGTEGLTALEQTLPAPGSGAYKQSLTSGKLAFESPGTYFVCAFLDDSQDRQFATDTGGEITVISASAARQCAVATKKLKKAKRSLKRLEHRIKKVKRQLHHASGAHRKALARKLHKLEAHKRKAARRRKAAARQVAGVCS